MSKDDPEYGPDLDGLRECKDGALKQLCVTVIDRLFQLLEVSAGEIKDLEKISKELRQWVNQLLLCDGHIGPVKLTDIEAAIGKLVEERQRIRGDKPAKAPPPSGGAGVGGVH